MTNNSNLDITHISKESGGYIAANYPVFENIPNNSTSRKILKEAIRGTPLVRLGDSEKGNNHKVMVVAGVHGNELPPQIAAVHLIDILRNVELNGEVHVIPFSAPMATMNNSRWFDSVDLNRVTSHFGSITNSILNKAKELKIDSAGDFHSTGPNSMPGKEGIFCTMKPSPESYHIGKYIANSLNSEIIFYPNAGQGYQGALEDECNLKGIPAVTCEVFCPNGVADEKTYKRSLEQMLSYLSYFGIIPQDFGDLLN